MTGQLIAVCVVHELIPNPPRGQLPFTAIDKRPVSGRVEVQPLGISGDAQYDTKHHGGLDQAVYAYADEEARRWEQELGRAVTPGWFGENLRVSGVATTDSVVGEIWQVGEVRLQVTKPRTPCATFAHYVDQPRWVKRFTEQGDVGTYLRVLTPGAVSAGDSITVSSRPSHGVTVREVFAAQSNRVADRSRIQLLLDHEASLAGELRQKLSERHGSRSQTTDS